MKFEKVRSLVSPKDAIEIHLTSDEDTAIVFGSIDKVDDRFSKMKVVNFGKKYPIMITTGEKEEKKDGIEFLLDDTKKEKEKSRDKKDKKSKKNKKKKKDDDGFMEEIENMEKSRKDV